MGYNRHYAEQKEPVVSTVTMHDIANFSEAASGYYDQLQIRLNRPNPFKTAPVFSSPAIAELCQIERSRMPYLAKKFNLPTGVEVPGSKAKEYSLSDAITWVKQVGNRPMRSAENGDLGRVYAVINYKGGVTKTTTAVSLAQSLTLRGLKVLLVDCDPQGSATQLFGINAEKDVDPETSTVMPFLNGEQPDLTYAVQETYWENLSLIPARSIVLEAEFAIPARAMEQKGFPFWLLIRDGLAPLRKEYDCIIIDTPPSLGHLSINVMFAADGLIMPSPPEKLDFTSSIKYWNVFQDLISYFPGADQKTYDFISILPTKVKSSEDHRQVKAQMKRAFADHMNAIEIPDSTAVSQALSLDKTIYDLPRPIGSYAAWRRYKEPMNQLADYVLLHLESAWSNSNTGAKA